MNLDRPYAPEDANAEWLTRVLRESGVLDEARVTDAYSTIIGQDTGFTGVVARLGLTYDREEPNAPTSLVAKFPLVARESQSSYREAGAKDPTGARAYAERCAREVSFYRWVGPGLTGVPEVVFAESDVEAGWILLLLEDLSDCEPGDALRGCSPEQAWAVLRAIAAIHAAWWEDPALDQQDWLPLWGTRLPSQAERFRERVDPFLNCYGDQIPAELHELMRLFEGRFEAVLGPLVDAPLTLIHCDLHLDNVMFRSRRGTPTAVILDWQSVSRGPALVDVALFIVGSLGVPDRREAELDLLRRYQEALTRAGVTGYRFSQLLDHYRRALLHQLAGIVGWLSRTSPEDLEGRDRALVQAILTDQQLFSTLIDHRSELLSLLRDVDGSSCSCVM